MNEKGKFLIILLVSFLTSQSISIAGTCNSNSCEGSNPWTAASASYEDVDYCINTCARRNDTVYVPEGNAEWRSQLTIGKPVRIIGAGSNSTIITSSYKASTSNSSDQRTCLISYTASTDPNPQTAAFRLTGFSFDLANKSGAIFMSNKSLIPLRNFRIDHNIFKNTVGFRTIYSWGQIWGVIDSNIFDNISSAVATYAYNSTTWINFTFEYGTANNLYIEDNIFKNLSSTPHSAGAGGRYAIRYNTYFAEDSGIYPWFDAHGNQINGHNSTMGIEIYGNQLFHTYPTSGVRLVDHRGGMGIIYLNNVDSPGTVIANLREEFYDGFNPPTTGVEGQPQHVSNSYYWGNRSNNSNLVILSINQDDYNSDQKIPNNPRVLVENRTHWQQRPGKFDGSGDINSGGGVGVGILSSRPSKCTVGVMYWATDQNISDLKGRVGVNPASPISGTLYKCIDTNTWVKYYKPFTYPHPLRTDTNNFLRITKVE